MSNPKRVGRRRWSELTKFLTETMQTSKSERVRMMAAMRLADVLTVREQRELAEMKVAARRLEAETLPEPISAEQSETVEGPISAESGKATDARLVWAKIEAEIQAGNGGNGAV